MKEPWKRSGLWWYGANEDHEFPFRHIEPGLQYTQEEVSTQLSEIWVWSSRELLPVNLGGMAVNLGGMAAERWAGAIGLGEIGREVCQASRKEVTEERPV